jgi:hypothetical protein
MARRHGPSQGEVSEVSSNVDKDGCDSERSVDASQVGHTDSGSRFLKRSSIMYTGIYYVVYSSSSS